MFTNVHGPVMSTRTLVCVCDTSVYNSCPLVVMFPGLMHRVYIICKDLHCQPANC
jgi:hypothetical protein